MSTDNGTTILDGLRFPECPRWHDGALWLAEKRGGRVLRVAGDGSVATVAEVPGGPGGIGWLPTGEMLVVSTSDCRLLQFAPQGDGREVADISHLTVGKCNDMVVDAQGRAYIGDFGYDMAAGDPPAPASLILVTPAGDCSRVAGELQFPNGAVVLPDGATLVVAESAANRLTAFQIDVDGSLFDRRVFAELGSVVPDGICLEDDGTIWVADPIAAEVVRVAEGGEVVDRLPTGDGAFACALGDDRLFVCTYTEAASMDPTGPPVGKVLAFDRP